MCFILLAVRMSGIAVVCCACIVKGMVFVRSWAVLERPLRLDVVSKQHALFD